MPPALNSSQSHLCQTRDPVKIGPSSRSLPFALWEGSVQEGPLRRGVADMCRTSSTIARQRRKQPGRLLPRLASRRLSATCQRRISVGRDGAESSHEAAKYMCTRSCTNGIIQICKVAKQRQGRREQEEREGASGLNVELQRGMGSAFPPCCHYVGGHSANTLWLAVRLTTSATLGMRADSSLANCVPQCATTDPAGRIQCPLAVPSAFASVTRRRQEA